MGARRTHGDMRNHKNFCSETLSGRKHLGSLSINGNLILKYILKKLYARLWTGLAWLRTGYSDGLFLNINVMCMEWL
jgi:hypothetical protein